MTIGFQLTLCALLIGGIDILAQSPTPAPEGRVTVVFHEVQLLPEQADARPAAVNDKVNEGTALRTGIDSRSELTFADLTITRLGANTIFSFNKAGRSIRLDGGAILLYARKNSGPAEISTKGVSVAISGTTIIFESQPSNYDRLTVLEGAARFSLNDHPDQSTVVHAGQLLNVQAGATKLPKPGRVDLRRIVNTHPLIRNFSPLPSLDLILGVQNQSARTPRQPVITGTGGQVGGPPYSSGPPPPGPPTSVGNPVGGPTPTAKPRHRPPPPPRPTVKPTPWRPGYPPKPTPTPKKKYSPSKRPIATPTPVHIR
jgi:FecR protein